MKIDQITLHNFRQYYGENRIDLVTEGGKNIILIGGKNGYGKSNFLLSLVWCLYGEDISKIDESFKHEIQKDGNYSKFLKNSFNWDALKEGQDVFSIEIHISNIELPESNQVTAGSNYSCVIRREYSIHSASDEFDIFIKETGEPLLNTQEEKINFVHHYIIPIEAAKFVFFDAEKIASWAELSTKEEGSILNDALGKILGLDVYETLISDLNIYTDGLRKESATALVKQQIITTEKGIELNVEKMEDLENEMMMKESEILKMKDEISKYEAFLARHAVKTLNTINLDELYAKRNHAKKREKELENAFNELCESIPFAIAAGKLYEVTAHISLQDKTELLNEKRNELVDKNNELIERLFNKPPFPGEGDISFSKKMFYADKAKAIVENIFGNDERIHELDFEHDLTKSDKELITYTFAYIQKQSRENFEQTINQYNRIKEEVMEMGKLIKRIESNLEDEEVLEYTNKKQEIERKLELIIEEKGSLNNQRENLRGANEKLSQALQVSLKKISVSEQKKKKLDKANLYIQSLETFVSEQKATKCSLLEQSILHEVQTIMHKKFIAAVKAELLPNNDGLKISIYDVDGNVIPKESLGMGEKQIYISSLIKAILKLAIQDFPIFIDTPLGRLDHEHIHRFLLNYYPNLAQQVVLMATNNEIPPSRYKLVKDNIAKAYILENNENKTHFKPGYFQAYEN